MRIGNQTVESVNEALDRFFKKEAKNIDLEKSLVVIDEAKIRIMPNSN